MQITLARGEIPISVVACEIIIALDRKGSNFRT